MRKVTTSGIIILFLFLISHPLQLSAQDAASLKDVMEPPSYKESYALNTSTSNELKMFFSGLFVFYKTFFSSQDGSHCSFTPSCSVYMKKAINHQGFLVGFMNGCDRLTRCHGLSPKQYNINREKQRYEDSIKNDPFVHSTDEE